MVVMVFGLPGSGKSYFATRLAAALRAEYVSSDNIRMKVLRHRSYSEREKRMIYNRMKSIMKDHLKKGRSVVMDATFYKDDLRESFITELDGKVAYRLIEVKAPEPTILERLKKRRPDSEADAAVYRKIKQKWEPCLRRHLRLDSSRPIRELLTEAKKYLPDHK